MSYAHTLETAQRIAQDCIDALRSGKKGWKRRLPKGIDGFWTKRVKNTITGQTSTVISRVNVKSRGRTGARIRRLIAEQINSRRGR